MSSYRNSSDIKNNDHQINNGSKIDESIVVSNQLVRDQIVDDQNANQIEQLDESDIIYKANIYDKLILSPFEKYQKYGKFPAKFCIHIFLVLLTTSQILYASNTLSTNSTEQYEYWRKLFYQEPSNINVKNNVFENKIIYYQTVAKLQRQFQSMFFEMNKNNSNRIQDTYFNYTDIQLKVFYNYPMDPSLSEHPIQEQEYLNNRNEEQSYNQSNYNHQQIDDQNETNFDLEMDDQKTQNFENQLSRNNTLQQQNQELNSEERDFYEKLNSDMNYQDIQRQLFFKNDKKNNTKNQYTQYKQVQLVFNIQRQFGIVNPFDMNNITQIKLQIHMNKVILIKSTLVSCWDFVLDYTLNGHVNIRSILTADGGACTDDLFQKGVKLHQEEYSETNNDEQKQYQDSSNMNNKRNIQAIDEKELEQNKLQFERNQIKEQQMKVRGTRNPIPDSQKNVFTQKNRSQRKYQGKFDEQQMKNNKLFLNDNQKILSGYSHVHYEKNGNLYRSGNLLFIGFNTFIDILTLAASIFSLVLCHKYIFQIMDVYIETFQKSTKVYLEKEEHKKLIQGLSKNKSNYLTLQRILAEQRPWHQLSLQEKFQYFDLWFFIIFLGNFFQLVGSFFLLFLDSQSELDQRTSIIDWTVGVGCFCSWISLMKYMEYSSGIAVFLDVLKFALPQLFKVLLEFSLLYVSFIIVGITSFWQSERFSDISSTAVTLFGLVMSDSIYAVIRDISQNGVLPYFMAEMYVILFVLMFIICVTNIMIGILEDGYSRNKQENKFKKQIKFISDEKERAVVSKLVESKQNMRGVSRRQASFDSDDGISYGKNIQKQISQYSSSPQPLQFHSPRVDSFNQYSNQSGLHFNLPQPLALKKSSFSQLSDKTSPKVQMKMVANAGIAIQKAKKFVQINKKKQQEKQDKEQQSQKSSTNQQPNLDDSQLRIERSLLEESSEPIFKVTDSQIEQEKTEKEIQEKIDSEKKQKKNTKSLPIRQKYSPKRFTKSKTLQSVGVVGKSEQIDEQSSESDDNEEIGIKQIQSEQQIEDIEIFIDNKTNREDTPSKRMAYSTSLVKSSDDLDMYRNSFKQQLSHSEIFKKELESLKLKEIFVEKTTKIFNTCYKRLEAQLEESNKLMRNIKFFSITKTQKKEINSKHQQYLLYFQQRVAAALLEIKHFEMEQ